MLAASNFEFYCHLHLILDKYCIVKILFLLDRYKYFMSIFFYTIATVQHFESKLICVFLRVSCEELDDTKLESECG